MPGYIVKTYFNGSVVDEQHVTSASQLVDNDYVVFDKEAELKETAGDNLTGGTTSTPTGESHEKARNIFESYFFNVLAVDTLDNAEQKAYVEWIKRLREEHGIKSQVLMPYVDGQKSHNYEGVIQFNVPVKDDSLSKSKQKTVMTYWLGGKEAGCPVQSSCMNDEYTGQYEIGADMTKADMLLSQKKGYIIFHLADGVPVMYRDINTLISLTDADNGKKNLSFNSNQVVRVVDALAMDTARIFTRNYLGKVNNNDNTRTALKQAIIKNRNAYLALGAIADYDESQTYVEQGENDTVVVGGEYLRVSRAMEYLFFNIGLIS